MTPFGCRRHTGNFGIRLCAALPTSVDSLIHRQAPTDLVSPRLLNCRLIAKPPNSPRALQINLLRNMGISLSLSGVTTVNAASTIIGAKTQTMLTATSSR